MGDRHHRGPSKAEASPGAARRKFACLAAKAPFAGAGRKPVCLLAVLGFLVSSVSTVGGQSQTPVAGLSSTGDPAFQTIERALERLSGQTQGAQASQDRAAPADLKRQKDNLELAKALLEIKNDHPQGSLEATFALAKKAMQNQVEVFGAKLEPKAEPKNDHQTPGQAALALARLYRPSLAEAEVQALERLDRLPGPLNGSLARYIEVFTQVVMDARALAKDLDKQKLNRPAATAGPSSPSATAKEVLDSIGVHPEKLLNHRIALLDATQDLADALKKTPGAAGALSDQKEPPAGALSDQKEPNGGQDNPAPLPPLALGPEKKGSTPLHLAAADPAVPSQCENDVTAPCTAPVFPPDCETDGSAAGCQTHPSCDSLGICTPEGEAGCEGLDAGSPACSITMSRVCDPLNQRVCTPPIQFPPPDCPGLGILPVMCIDLDQTSSDGEQKEGHAPRYTNYYALQIDGGGNDIYLYDPSDPSSNRAGGNGVLLDLGGDDLYLGPPPVGPTGGVFGFLFGFLVDLSGNDEYGTDDHPGTNGSGLFSPAFLMDAQDDDDDDDDDTVQGNDRYRGGNGSGYDLGMGLLVDGAGNDDYSSGAYCSSCRQGGTANGAGDGGNLIGATGHLLDADGNDVYTSPNPGPEGDPLKRPRASNGGGTNGSGFLWDGGGGDKYLAPGDTAGNGAGVVTKNIANSNGSGFLFDSGGGTDFYRDPHIRAEFCLEYDEGTGTGKDCTMAPKPHSLDLDGEQISGSGVQIDDSKPPGPAPPPDLFKEPAVSISNSSNPEGDSGSLPFIFTVRLSRPASVPVTVWYSTADGGARVNNMATVADHDYNPVVDGRVDFARGESAKTISIDVYGDTKPELDEQFSVKLKAAEGAKIAGGTGEGTILNEDHGLNVASVHIRNGRPAKEGGDVVFAIGLVPAWHEEVTVWYETRDGSAVAPGDYETTIASVTFQPGQEEKYVPVPTKRDSIAEGDEVFFAFISRVDSKSGNVYGGGAYTEDDRGRGIIEDQVPGFTVSDVKAPEGDPVGPRAESCRGRPDATCFNFRVSVEPQPGPASVRYATENGGAVSPEDYGAQQGTLSFSPGETVKDVTVQVTGDFLPERDEVFHLNLSEPTGAPLGDAQGRGEILDDDDGLSADQMGGPGGFTGGSRGPRGSQAGGVFVSGHNSDFHASRRGGFSHHSDGWPYLERRNMAGAVRVVQSAVSFVTGAMTSPRLLYVASSGVRGEDGLQTAGFEECAGDKTPPGGCFDVAASGGRREHLGEFAGYATKKKLILETVDFWRYDAVIAASKTGGLTQQDLTVLNARKGELLSYVKSGGGLIAFAESGWDDTPENKSELEEQCSTSNLACDHFSPKLLGQYGFVPCVRDCLRTERKHQLEEGFKTTGAGKAIGLSDGDVNGNASDNVFPDPAGYDVADVDSRGLPVSLAKFCGAGCFIDRQEGDPDRTDDSGGGKGGAGGELGATPPVLVQPPPVSQPAGPGTTLQEVPGQLTQGNAQLQLPQAPIQQAQPQGQEQIARVAQKQSQAELEVMAAAMMQEEKEEQAHTETVGPGRPGTQGYQARVSGSLLPAPAGAIGALGGLLLFMIELTKGKRQPAPLRLKAPQAGSRPRRPAPRRRRRL